jgi:hypothetical protein
LGVLLSQSLPPQEDTASLLVEWHGGETWEGTLHTEGTLGGCLDSWDGRLEFVVGEDGRISGEGRVETTGRPGCTVLGGAAGTPYTERFGVAGWATGTHFELEFLDPTDTCLSIAANPQVSVACWGVPGGRVPRSDNLARGTFTTALGPTTFETTVDLRCTGCSSSQPR